MLRTFAAALILALPLAACGSDGDGTTIAINASGADGNMVAGVDGKTGDVSINVPGFSGNIKLPKIKFNADNFDMNGVHLYPGSTISGMNIDAHDGGGADGDKKDSGNVRVTFESPASPATVQQWFIDKLNKDAGFKVQADGTGVSGKTDEDQAFKLELTPVGADHAKGTLVVGG